MGVADHELSVSFVDSQTIQNLNKEHRDKDSATDVLSFPQCEFSPPLRCSATSKDILPFEGTIPPQTLGDVIISLDEAFSNAKKIGQDIEKEVCFLIVHGVLHLCGHDHIEKDDEEKMLQEQRALMTLIETEANAPKWVSTVKNIATDKESI